MNDQIVLSRRHGTWHEERWASPLVAPAVAYRLRGRRWLVPIPTVGRCGRALDRRVWNVNRVQEMWLECIKTLVVHQTLENSE